MDKHRVTSLDIVLMFGSLGDEKAGMFEIPAPWGATLRIIACAGDGWDHVSVSTQRRCPNWHEMEFAKRLFFEDDEIAMQLHVTPADHINVHPYCLHLWRPHGQRIPLPPKEMVG